MKTPRVDETRYISPDEILEGMVSRVDGIECEITDGIVVRTDKSKNERIIVLGLSANDIVAPETLPAGVPDNCPLRTTEGRSIDSFARACGSCTVSTIVLLGSIYQGAPPSNL